MFVQKYDLERKTARQKNQPCGINGIMGYEWWIVPYNLLAEVSRKAGVCSVKMSLPSKQWELPWETSQTLWLLHWLPFFKVLLVAFHDRPPARMGSGYLCWDLILCK